jgi:hypothetical protein
MVRSTTLRALAHTPEPAKLRLATIDLHVRGDIATPEWNRQD